MAGEEKAKGASAQSLHECAFFAFSFLNDGDPSFFQHPQRILCKDALHARIARLQTFTSVEEAVFRFQRTATLPARTHSCTSQAASGPSVWLQTRIRPRLRDRFRFEYSWRVVRGKG